MMPSYETNSSDSTHNQINNTTLQTEYIRTKSFKHPIFESLDFINTENNEEDLKLHGNNDRIPVNQFSNFNQSTSAIYQQKYREGVRLRAHRKASWTSLPNTFLNNNDNIHDEELNIKLCKARKQKLFNIKSNPIKRNPNSLESILAKYIVLKDDKYIMLQYKTCQISSNRVSYNSLHYPDLYWRAIILRDIKLNSTCASSLKLKLAKRNILSQTRSRSRLLVKYLLHSYHNIDIIYKSPSSLQAIKAIYRIYQTKKSYNSILKRMFDIVSIQVGYNKQYNIEEPKHTIRRVSCNINHKEIFHERSILRTTIKSYFIVFIFYLLVVNLKLIDKFNHHQLRLQTSGLKRIDYSRIEGSIVTTDKRKHVHVDHASKQLGSKIIWTIENVKNVDNILMKDQDKYILSKCAEPLSFVISLHDAIIVRQIIIVEQEHFVGHWEHVDFYGAYTYSDLNTEYKLLGSFRRNHDLEVQSLQLTDPNWWRYVKVIFSSSFDAKRYEYCSLTQIRIYGTSGQHALREALKDSVNLPNDYTIKDLPDINSWSKKPDIFTNKLINLFNSSMDLKSSNINWNPKSIKKSHQYLNLPVEISQYFNDVSKEDKNITDINTYPICKNIALTDQKDTASISKYYNHKFLLTNKNQSHSFTTLYYNIRELCRKYSIKKKILCQVNNDNYTILKNSQNEWINQDYHTCTGSSNIFRTEQHNKIIIEMEDKSLLNQYSNKKNNIADNLDTKKNLLFIPTAWCFKYAVDIICYPGNDLLFAYIYWSSIQNQTWFITHCNILTRFNFKYEDVLVSAKILSLSKQNKRGIKLFCTDTVKVYGRFSDVIKIHTRDVRKIINIIGICENDISFTVNLDDGSFFIVNKIQSNEINVINAKYGYLSFSPNFILRSKSIENNFFQIKNAAKSLYDIFPENVINYLSYKLHNFVINFISKLEEYNICVKYYHYKINIHNKNNIITPTTKKHNSFAKDSSFLLNNYEAKVNKGNMNSILTDTIKKVNEKYWKEFSFCLSVNNDIIKDNSKLFFKSLNTLRYFTPYSSNCLYYCNSLDLIDKYDTEIEPPYLSITQRYYYKIIKNVIENNSLNSIYTIDQFMRLTAKRHQCHQRFQDNLQLKFIKDFTSSSKPLFQYGSNASKKTRFWDILSHKINDSLSLLSRKKQIMLQYPFQQYNLGSEIKIIQFTLLPYTWRCEIKSTYRHNWSNLLSKPNILTEYTFICFRLDTEIKLSDALQFDISINNFFIQELGIKNPTNIIDARDEVKFLVYNPQISLDRLQSAIFRLITLEDNTNKMIGQIFYSNKTDGSFTIIYREKSTKSILLEFKKQLELNYSFENCRIQIRHGNQDNIRTLSRYNDEQTNPYTSDEKLLEVGSKILNAQAHPFVKVVHYMQVINMRLTNIKSQAQKSAEQILNIHESKVDKALSAAGTIETKMKYINNTIFTIDRTQKLLIKYSIFILGIIVIITVMNIIISCGVCFSYFRYSQSKKLSFPNKKNILCKSSLEMKNYTRIIPRIKQKYNNPNINFLRKSNLKKKQYNIMENKFRYQFL